MNTFEQLREFLSLFEIGDIITRKEIMANEFGGDATIDNYRNWFTKAAYLRWIKRGQYELINYPSTELTSRDLRKEAYPHYMNWEEYRYAR